MKHLFLLDRPDSPANIDLFRTWEESTHFKEIDLFTLNDQLSGNFIEADIKFGRDATNLYQIEVEVLPIERLDSGNLKVLGRLITTYQPTADDLTGEDLLDTHQIVDRAVQTTVMNWGLRVRVPELAQHQYLEYSQLRGNLDPIVSGIGIYKFVEDRGRFVKHYHRFKITVALMLQRGLMGEVIHQLDPQVFHSDNWGRNLDGNSLEVRGVEWDDLSEAGIGNSDFFRAIKENSFDQIAFIKPGLE